MVLLFFLSEKKSPFNHEQGQERRHSGTFFGRSPGWGGSNGRIEEAQEEGSEGRVAKQMDDAVDHAPSGGVREPKKVEPSMGLRKHRTCREAETPLPLLPLFVYSPSERTPQWGPTDKGPGSRRFLFCGVTERIGQYETRERRVRPRSPLPGMAKEIAARFPCV